MDNTPFDMASEFEFVNIDVVYMEYNPKRDPKSPLVQFDGHCLVGLVDLHNHRVAKRSQKNLMDPRAFKHYNWYNAILQEELYEAPIGYRLQVFHWNIESGIRDAFKIRGLQFNAVTMIIGPNMEYWYGINTSSRDAFTKRGRYPRGQPIKPSDQYRYLLPRCPIVLASCNCCDQYFERKARQDAAHQTEKRCDDKAKRARRSLSLSPPDPTVTDQIRDCDKGLFDTINAACSPVPDPFDAAVGADEADDTDDDDDEEGGQQDILFFKISMCKFRRTEATTYNKLTSIKNKLNIRNLKRKLATIIEEYQ